MQIDQRHCKLFLLYPQRVCDNAFSWLRLGGIARLLTAELYYNGYCFFWELVPMIFHWLICIQNQQFSKIVWCMLGGSVWIWMKSNLFRFIEGQTTYSTSWHAKMSLTLNGPIKNVLLSNLHTTSNHEPKTYWTWKVLYAKQPTPDQNSCWWFWFLRWTLE